MNIVYSETRFSNIKVLSILLLLALPLRAIAFDVSPLTFFLAPSGVGANAHLEVRNSTSSVLPVELSVFELELDEVTRSVRLGRSADDELLVFPPAALIKAGSLQSFRMQWLGTRELDSSRSYIVAIEQLPIENPSESAGDVVDVVLTFNAIVHVASPAFAPQLEVASSAGVDQAGTNTIGGDSGQSADARQLVSLLLSNVGTGIAFGNRIELKLTAGNGAVSLVRADDLKALVGELFIPPGSSQVVVFEKPVDLEGDIGHTTVLYGKNR